MDLLRSLVDVVLHLDTHLAELSGAYGPWLYGILALIIFCETGLVVTPFLPGDSLLFAAGALAAVPVAGGDGLNVHLLVVLLTACAIAGDSVNYAIGRRLGARAYKLRFINPAHLDRTQAFYARHGGKTIVLARFVPIVRTFAPFVAGVGHMEYRKFVTYNVVGALVWVPTFLYAGYFFGNLPVVKDNFGLVVVGVIVLSLVPLVVEFVKGRRARATPTV